MYFSNHNLLTKLFFSIYIAITLIFTSCEKSNEIIEIEDPQINQTGQAEISMRQSWQRVFTDEFYKNGGTGKWQKTNRKDYNSNICNYKPENVSIATLDGQSCLKLEAYKKNGQYKSGHVKSWYKFKPAENEEYRVSASIKLIAKKGSEYKGFAQTYGAWPAFWTVKEDNWPVNGEIDIMEGYSYGTWAKFASNLFYGTKYLKPILDGNALRKYKYGEGWHKYEMVWRNKNGYVSVKILFNGKQVAYYDNSKVGNGLALNNFGPHNIILNMNVGSTGKTGGIFDNSKINLFSNTSMYVDYVRVDKRKIN